MAPSLAANEASRKGAIGKTFTSSPRISNATETQAAH
jgi:hypothetical protein